MGRAGRLVAAVTLSIVDRRCRCRSLTAAGRSAAAGNDDDQGAEVWLTESENGVNPAAENAGTLPLVHWRTMFTRHFRIHFYDEDRSLADRAAMIAERAHYRLTHYLNWLPSGRIDITINDHTDDANGFASSVPQNYLFAYGAPPASLDELNDFDDFFNLLITHELTHVVHLDTILGPARYINILRGKLYAPNLSQPTWFVEGLAVLMESRQTSGGRVRSSFFDMELRVPFLEGKMLGLDAVSNGPLAFPQGSAIYLYGSSLLKYIEDRYGPDKIREISHRYASRLIPGGLSRVSREAIGRGYDELVGGLERIAEPPLFAGGRGGERRGLTPTHAPDVRRAGPARGARTRTTSTTGAASSTRRRRRRESPGVRAAGSGQRKVTRADGGLQRRRRGAHARRARAGLPAHQLPAAAPPHLGRIATSAGTICSGVDLDVGRGARADAQPSRARARRLARRHRRSRAPWARTGRRDLAIVPITGGAPKVLAARRARPGLRTVLVARRAAIAYSRYKPGGFRDIHVFDLAAGRDRALWVDRAMDMDPSWSPDGRFIVFSSDRTGIFNLYAYEVATERLYQVTNLLVAARSSRRCRPTASWWSSPVHVAGVRRLLGGVDPASWPLAQPFANTRPDAQPVTLESAHAPGERPDAPLVEKITEYHPWRYFYPRNWLLTVRRTRWGWARAWACKPRSATPCSTIPSGSMCWCRPAATRRCRWATPTTGSGRRCRCRSRARRCGPTT